MTGSLLSISAIAVAVALVAPGKLSAAAEISASVSSHRARVAEPIVLRLSVTARDGARVAFPRLKDSLGGLEIVTGRRLPDVPEGDNRRWVAEWELESLEPGEYVLPELEVVVSAESGPGDRSDAVTLRTEPIPVEILSTLAPDADPMAPREIADVVDAPISEPLPQPNRWWWAVIGMATIAVAALVSTLWRRGETTPRQWARDRLDAMGRSLAEGAEPATVVADVAGVVRDYVRVEFGVPTNVMPTRDWVEETVRRGQLDPSMCPSLEDLFRRADEAKFAAGSVGEAEARAAIELASRVVGFAGEGQ